MSAWKWDPARKAWRKDLWHAGRRVKLTFRGTKKEAEEYEARKRIELGASDVVREKDAPAFETFCVERYKPAATLSDGLVRELKAQKLRVGGSAWVFPVRTDGGDSKGKRYVVWPRGGRKGGRRPRQTCTARSPRPPRRPRSSG